MGLKEDEIPLSARIMSIADVFDAVSQKRCYRDAMPLDECFEIIQKGKGWDFDPLLVDIFLSIRPQVEQIYKKIYG
jgi:response regulator RpfG family c-di-GMP phosphodiesterase